MKKFISVIFKIYLVLLFIMFCDFGYRAYKTSYKLGYEDGTVITKSGDKYNGRITRFPGRDYLGVRNGREWIDCMDKAIAEHRGDEVKDCQYLHTKINKDDIAEIIIEENTTRSNYKNDSHFDIPKLIGELTGKQDKSAEN